ncbi:MAG: shikimate dehydrogenase [Bacillota bacterium]
MIINGETIVVGLFGDPVSHSLSPAMHNAAFQERDLNFCYLPFHVCKEDLPGAVKAICSLGLRGVNVTAPHKEAIVPYLNDLSAEAGFLNAVNTIVNRGGKLSGHNTDVYGFLFLLQNNLGKTFSAEKACLLGAGGAARAVALALNRVGVKSLVIANRTTARAEHMASFLMENRILKDSAVSIIKLDKKNLQENAANATLMINALSEDPFELGFLPQAGLQGCRVAIDLRYHSLETPFMKWAAGNGVLAFNGLDMLLGQGIKAFEIFTGVQAPVGIMREALVKGLK